MKEFKFQQNFALLESSWGSVAYAALPRWAALYTAAMAFKRDISCVIGAK